MKTIIALLLITTSTFAITREECDQLKETTFHSVLYSFTTAKKQYPIPTRLTVATCTSEIVHAECILNNDTSEAMMKGAIDICWME